MIDEQEAQDRRRRLSRALRVRAKLYDKTVAWIEGLGTGLGGVALGIGGAVVNFNVEIGGVLIFLGTIATVISLILIVVRQRGVIQAIADATAAAHDGEVMRAQGETLATQAWLVVRNQQDQFEAVHDAAMKLTSRLETEIVRKDEQIRGIQALGEMRSRCLVLTRTLLEMAQRFILRDQVQRNLTFALQMLLNTVESTGGKAALGFEPGVRWTISIFRRLHLDNKEVLRREHVLRWDGDRTLDGRTWTRGEAYSGQAWLTGMPVVLMNTADAPEIVREQENVRPTDSDKYKSVVAIPVRLGQEIWGVVTATSDQVGHFGNEGDGVAPQLHTDSMRSLAAFVSLLVAGSTA